VGAWLPEWGQAITVLIMAFALGMDAFSLGFGLGMRGMPAARIVQISSVIALFHVIMPLAGMFAGQYVSAILGDVAMAAGGGLLVLLGSHMIYSAVWGESASPSFEIKGLISLLAFALSVSIDSFSVGITLGLFASDLLFTVLMFGIAGGVMSVLGLAAGRRVGRYAGGYGEALGGAILLAFGLNILF
jgi:putative Mn2+ efflux pump MntP